MNSNNKRLEEEIQSLRLPENADPEIQASMKKIDYIKKNNPHVDMSVNQRCQEILASNEPASKKMEDMVGVFLSEYPTYILPEDRDLCHPSYLARYFDIPMWLTEQCGDVVRFYRLYLDAAKDWFPVDTGSKLEGAFRVRFESLGLVSHLGEDEAMQPIWEDYFSWWRNREQQD